MEPAAAPHDPPQTTAGPTPVPVLTEVPLSPPGGSQPTPPLYRGCDGFTEGLIYFGLVFSPWVFGSTQEWAVWVMNATGYALGALLAVKGWIRWRTGYRPARWGDSPETGGPIPWPQQLARWSTVALAGLTLLILAYCLISAVNARATYVLDQDDAYKVVYHECLFWLPHSYDSRLTWFVFWEYLGLALMFWALRDWLLGKSRAERHRPRDESKAFEDYWALAQQKEAPRPRRHWPLVPPLPARLKRLLWVLSVNGAVLGVEAILQRLDNSNRLLWLIQPRINDSADGQFGPYAYRSNAAQYFNLVWPLCLGLWWVLRHQVKNSLRSAARVGSSAHAMLLPGAVVMAACPIIATSRGGAIVAAVGMALAFSVMLLASSRGHWGGRLGLIALFAAMISFAGYLGWDKLEERLRYIFTDEMSGRVEIYENSRKIVKDLPVYGTGPGTFASMYHLYRANPQQVWQAYLHDDWLETRVTFGAVGLSLILLALGLVFARGFATGGIVVPPPFVALVWLALAGCLFHARYDFPLQVHSILSLFLTLCAILFCCSRKT